jgi:hypothetical protein
VREPAEGEAAALLAAGACVSAEAQRLRLWARSAAGPEKQRAAAAELAGRRNPLATCALPPRGQARAQAGGRGAAPPRSRLAAPRVTSRRELPLELRDIRSAPVAVPVYLPRATAAHARTTPLAAATAQRQRFVGACSIVLLTFLLRASFDLLNAYANVNIQRNLLCGFCDPCQSDQWLINNWLQYTPEFQSIVVALSSPLPLVVSLWLMMTKEDRMLLVLLEFPAANENANLLPEQTQHRVLASRQNMAIDLL